MWVISLNFKIKKVWVLCCTQNAKSQKLTYKRIHNFTIKKILSKNVQYQIEKQYVQIGTFDGLETEQLIWYGKVWQIRE